MRNMSFFLTTKQMRRRKKTVTRRLGWWNVYRGELIQAVEKGQGLKKGEKVKKIAVIRIKSAWCEPLFHCDSRAEVRREGFPGMSPVEFVAMFKRHHKLKSARTAVNRIAFEFL